MLCQFTVRNYKSIRDEMTFDMQAAAISEHEDHVINDKRKAAPQSSRSFSAQRTQNIDINSM